MVGSMRLQNGHSKSLKSIDVTTNGATIDGHVKNVFWIGLRTCIWTLCFWLCCGFVFLNALGQRFFFALACVDQLFHRFLLLLDDRIEGSDRLSAADVGAVHKEVRGTAHTELTCELLALVDELFNLIALAVFVELLDIKTELLGEFLVGCVVQVFLIFEQQIVVLPELALLASGIDRKSTRLNSSHVAISYA